MVRVMSSIAFMASGPRPMGSGPGTTSTRPATVTAVAGLPRVVVKEAGAVRVGLREASLNFGRSLSLRVGLSHQPSGSSRMYRR